MASAGLEEELTCPVCQDIFRNPVLLSCSHSFCKACLKRWWKQKEERDCPICKCPSGRKVPTCNLVLKNTCEAFLLERERQAAAESELVCSLHSEKLKLFCLDHQQPVCLICRDSKVHKEHKFRPIDEVAQEQREELQETLRPLQEKLKFYKQVQGNLDQTAEHIVTQAQHTETQIRKQFQEMHQFLHEEEETRLSALKEEEKKKHVMVKTHIGVLNRQIAALSDTISTTQKQLRSNDVSFMQNYDSTVQRVRYTPSQAGPKPVSGALIDQAKHLGNLCFNIWNKMKDLVSYTPVILDPNTAEVGLVLSADLTRVRRGDKQNLPENPERFGCHGVVLASEGFTEGSHSWVVEVGDNTAWFVGVAAETFGRKGPVDLKSGLWALAFSKGKYSIISHLNPSSFQTTTKLQAVSVHLDLERGRLTLSDPATKTHIRSFSHCWTERMFPIFYTGSELPLKILPVGLNDNLDDDDDDGDSDEDENSPNRYDVPDEEEEDCVEIG